MRSLSNSEPRTPNVRTAVYDTRCVVRRSSLEAPFATEEQTGDALETGLGTHAEAGGAGETVLGIQLERVFGEELPLEAHERFEARAAEHLRVPDVQIGAEIAPYFECGARQEIADAEGAAPRCAGVGCG